MFSSGMVSLFKEPVPKEDDRFFKLKAVLTATWLPCVVANKSKQNTFLQTALASLTIRYLAIFCAIMMYNYSFPVTLEIRTTHSTLETSQTPAGALTASAL